MENITLRKPQKCTSFEDLSHINEEKSSFLLNSTVKSLPGNDYFNTTETSHLKEKLTSAQSDLESAHEEIGNLNEENYQLRKQIDELSKKVEVLMKLTNQPITSHTPKTTHSGTPLNRFRKRLEYRNVAVSSTPLSHQLNLEMGTTCDTQRSIQMNKSILVQTATNKKTYNPKDDVATVCPLPTHCHNKKRVHLFSDDEGRGMRPILQRLLGEDFIVTSTLKPNATLDQIMADCESICKNFTKDDYVVILTKSSDKNPLKLQSFFFYNLNLLHFTNVLFGEVCKSMFLNEQKLNNVIRIICNNFEHTTFVDFRTANINTQNKLHKCQILLREILRQGYHLNYNRYVAKNVNGGNPNIGTAEKSTQTTHDCNNGESNVEEIRESILKSPEVAINTVHTENCEKLFH